MVHSVMIPAPGAVSQMELHRQIRCTGNGNVNLLFYLLIFYFIMSLTAATGIPAGAADADSLFILRLFAWMLNDAGAPVCRYRLPSP